MADQIIFAVYVPPKADLPFLAVMIGLDGKITAVPYSTCVEAENHNQYHAADLDRRLKEAGNA